MALPVSMSSCHGGSPRSDLLIHIAALCVCLTGSGRAGEAPGGMFTAREGAEVDAVLEQAIVLGFPEVRDAQWCIADDRAQSLDLHLARGGWLTSEGMMLLEQDHSARPSDAAELAARLTTSGPEDLPWQLLRVPPEYRAHLMSSATLSLGGLLSNQISNEDRPNIPDMALSGAIMRRCSHAEIGDALLLQAQYYRTRSEYGLCVTPAEAEHYRINQIPGRRWDEQPLEFLLNYSEWPRWDLATKQSAALPPLLTMISVPTVLRRECHWWFRQRLIEATPAAAPALAAAALDVLEPADRARAAEDISLLLARAGISEHPSPSAPLAQRLAAWDKVL